MAEISDSLCSLVHLALILWVSLKTTHADHLLATEVDVKLLSICQLLLELRNELLVGLLLVVIGRDIELALLGGMVVQQGVRLPLPNYA